MVQSLYGANFNSFKQGNGGYTLLNAAAKEYVFGTLKSSLPRSWKQYFAQLEEKWWQNLKKQQESVLLKNVF